MITLICRQCDSTKFDTDEKQFNGQWLIYDPEMWNGGFTVGDEIGVGHTKKEAMEDFYDELDSDTIVEILWQICEVK